MPFAELYRENIVLKKSPLQGERAGRGKDEDRGGLAWLPSRLSGSQHEGAASVKILFAIEKLHIANWIFTLGKVHI